MAGVYKFTIIELLFTNSQLLDTKVKFVDSLFAKKMQIHIKL